MSNVLIHQSVFIVFCLQEQQKSQSLKQLPTPGISSQSPGKKSRSFLLSSDSDDDDDDIKVREN